MDSNSVDREPSKEEAFRQSIVDKLSIKPGDPANGLMIVSSLFLVISVQILTTLDPQADVLRSVPILRGCVTDECRVHANAVVSNSVLALSVSIWIICISLLVMLMDYAVKCILSMTTANWRWNVHGFTALTLIQVYIFCGGSALIYNGWLIGQAMISLVALRAIPIDDTRTAIPKVDVDEFVNLIQNTTSYPTGTGIEHYQNVWFAAQIVVAVFVAVSLPLILAPYYVLSTIITCEPFRPSEETKSIVVQDQN